MQSDGIPSIFLSCQSISLCSAPTCDFSWTFRIACCNCCGSTPVLNCWCCPIPVVVIKIQFYICTGDRLCSVITCIVIVCSIITCVASPVFWSLINYSVSFHPDLIVSSRKRCCQIICLTARAVPDEIEATCCKTCECIVIPSIFFRICCSSITWPACCQSASSCPSIKTYTCPVVCIVVMNCYIIKHCICWCLKCCFICSIQIPRAICLFIVQILCSFTCILSHVTMKTLTTCIII